MENLAPPYPDADLDLPLPAPAPSPPSAPARRRRRGGIALAAFVIAILLFVIAAPGWANGLLAVGDTIEIDDTTSLPIPTLWYDSGWADGAGDRGRSVTIHGGARGDRWISFSVLPGLSGDASRYESSGIVSEDALGVYRALRIDLGDGTVQFAVPDLSLLVLVRTADEATMRQMFERTIHRDEPSRSA